MKKCTKCKINKDLNDYSCDRHTLDKKCYQCRKCQQEHKIHKRNKYLVEILKILEKQCERCKRNLLLENIYCNNYKDKAFKLYCLDCHKKIIEENSKNYSKKCNKKRRLEVIQKYGNGCAICGESKIEFLCIDHINGKGTKHRQELGGTSALYTFLKNNDIDLDQYRVLCQNCNQKESIINRSKNVKQDNENRYKRNEYKNLRHEVIHYYGAKCDCCDISSDINYLSIDHINGGGKQHMKEIGGPDKVCRWLKKNNYPDGFRILCHNCNFSYGQYGYCPHNN